MTIQTISKFKLRLLTGAFALAGFGGCKQQLFIEPADYKEAIAAGLPPRLETHPHDAIAPSSILARVPPATAIDPSRPAKFLSLKEAIATAVEHGNLGNQGGVQNAGFQNDSTVQFGGRAVGGTDSIRALVLDPAVVGADIERALSKFDARWITSLSWNKQDQAQISTLQQSFSNGDQAAFSTTLAKPLPTGGVSGITFSTNYQNLSAPPSQNGFVALTTAYTPRVQFIFEQPLLQGFGVEINQLSSQHPGSQLIQGLRPSGGTTTEGILITRIRYDQQKAEFDRQVNQMLVNVEYAYWNLYAAYYNLYAQEEILRQSFDLVTILEKRFAAGTITKQELTQTRAQYYQFRFSVFEARQQILNAERALRGLLGLNSYSDGVRLVPTDEPTLAPYTPDFAQSANEALMNRPELILARQDLKFRQLDLILQKNTRRPDLRFFASYDVQGLGSRLDGPESRTTTNALGQSTTTPVNALDSLNNNQFNSWQLGLRLDMPLGFRDANAAVRQGQLNLVRSYYQLEDSERKVVEVIIQQTREIELRQNQIGVARMRRIDLQETLKLNRQLIETGPANFVNSLFNVLQVQQNTAQAIATEFQTIAQYNQAIAGLEWAKGTIQGYNNVMVGEGALPAHVNKKAADHFAARANALKLREHPADLPLHTLSNPPESPLEKLPANIDGGGMPMMPAPEKLPSPKQMSVPGGPTAYMPGEPAPSRTTQWPSAAGALPTIPTAAEVAESPFKPVDTVKLPRRNVELPVSTPQK